MPNPVEIQYVDKQGLPIRDFNANPAQHPDPSAGVIVKIHTTDSQDTFILSGKIAIAGRDCDKNKLGVGGSCERNADGSYTSFEDTAVYEYHQETYHAIIDFAKDNPGTYPILDQYLADNPNPRLLPRIALEDLDAKRFVLDGGKYVRVNFETILYMNLRDLQTTMKTMHDLAAVCLQQRKALLDSPEYPETATGKRGTADKTSKFYCSNLRYAAKTNPALQPLADKLTKLDEATEFSAFNLLDEPALCTLAQTWIQNESKGIKGGLVDCVPFPPRIQRHP